MIKVGIKLYIHASTTKMFQSLNIHTKQEITYFKILGLFCLVQQSSPEHIGTNPQASYPWDGFPNEPLPCTYHT